MGGMKRTASQVGRMSRQKGASYENRIAHILSLWWTDGKSTKSTKVFKRTVMSGGWDKRFAAGDLLAPEPNFPIHFELRKREEFDLSFIIKDAVVMRWWQDGLETKDSNKRLWYIMSRNMETDYLLMDAETWHAIASMKPVNPNRMECWVKPYSIVVFILKDFLAMVPPWAIKEALKPLAIQRCKSHTGDSK